MELVHATIKFITEPLDFTVAEFIEFFQQLPYRLLNLALKPVKLFERIIDQFLNPF
ncbi:hypothetical protein [Marinobacter confluentis]|uniref:hypothetical protein n=1 Tax=Marinobacter confluentis TaxID=1697557 RepID=UPI0029820B6F|nr:hypothetical protein [Marinobacter confluentis]